MNSALLIDDATKPVIPRIIPIIAIIQAPLRVLKQWQHVFMVFSFVSSQLEHQLASDEGVKSGNES